MFQGKIFIGKRGIGIVNRFTTGSIATCEITALQDEAFDDAVKDGPTVAQWDTGR
jgi:hypothetical protein